jgi:hypothetical protein
MALGSYVDERRHYRKKKIRTVETLGAPLRLIRQEQLQRMMSYNRYILLNPTHCTKKQIGIIVR